MFSKNNIRIGAILCMAMPLIALALGARAEQPAFPTVTVEPQRLETLRLYDGRIEAVDRATVSAQVSGRIEEVLFDVDDFVEQGEVLVRFRNPEQQAGVDRARAALQEARAREQEAAAEYARIKDVFERKLVSRSAMDEAEAADKAARAKLKAAQAALVQAQETLENTLVRAPYSGIVTERHVEAGETATPGQPLMSGISLDRLRVTTQVPQSVAHDVRARGQAVVMLPGTDREPIDSRSVTVFPYADADSHSFRVRVDLPNGVEGLFPGMLVKVGFAVGERTRLLVPESAVVARSELTGVYVLADDERIRFRQVRLGERRDGKVEILSGLEAGETVALDPVAAGIALKSAPADAP